MVFFVLVLVCVLIGVLGFLNSVDGWLTGFRDLYVVEEWFEVRYGGNVVVEGWLIN